MRPEDVLARDPRVLSQAERGAYFEQGYVLCRGLLDGDWLARMRNAYGRAVERSRDAAASNRWFSLQPAHSAAEPRINRIERLPDQDPAFWDVAVNSRAADLAADVVGPDVVYRDSMITAASKSPTKSSAKASMEYAVA